MISNIKKRLVEFLSIFFNWNVFSACFIIIPIVLFNIFPLFSCIMFGIYLIYHLNSYRLLLLKRKNSPIFVSVRDRYRNSLNEGKIFFDKKSDETIKEMLLEIQRISSKGQKTFYCSLIKADNPIVEQIFSSESSIYHNESLVNEYRRYTNSIVDYFRDNGFNVEVIKSFDSPRWIQISGWD